jgi:PAS domain S-box-containing protein
VKDKTIRRILGFFLLVVAIFIVVAFEAVRNINQSVSSSDWVNHTHSVILESEGLRSDLFVAEGALRTFVSSGDARDQSACRDALGMVMDHVEIIKALTRLEPTQNAEITQLESLVNQRATFMREVLRARLSGNLETVRSLLASDAGGEASREIQGKIKRLKDEELGLLTERDTAAYLQAQTTRWTVWLGVALDVLLLGGALWLIRDDLAARRQAASALTEANAQLDVRVRERTIELTSANAQLATENLERQWANQALEHQNHYNELIINSINDLVLVLTKTLKISRVNPAVSHLTGWEPADLINQQLYRFVRLIPPAGAAGAPFADRLAQALKSGRDLPDQAATVEDKRGRLIPVRFALYPLRDRDKVVGGVVTLQVVPPAVESPPTSPSA